MVNTITPLQRQKPFVNLRVTLSLYFWWHTAVRRYSDVCWISEMCCRCITLTPRINAQESAVLFLLPNCMTALHCFRHHVSPTPGLVGNVPQCHDSPVNTTKYVTSTPFNKIHTISKCFIAFPQNTKLKALWWVSYRQSIVLKERRSHPSGWSTLSLIAIVWGIKKWTIRQKEMACNATPGGMNLTEWFTQSLREHRKTVIFQRGNTHIPLWRKQTVVTEGDPDGVRLIQALLKYF